MAIDPDTQAVLDMIRLAGRPPFEMLTPAEARQAYSASRKLLQPAPEEIAESRDSTVPGPLGPIGIRLYRPKSKTGLSIKMLGPSVSESKCAGIAIRGFGQVVRGE